MWIWFILIVTIVLCLTAVAVIVYKCQGDRVVEDRVVEDVPTSGDLTQDYATSAELTKNVIPLPKQLVPPQKESRHCEFQDDDFITSDHYLNTCLENNIPFVKTDLLYGCTIEWRGKRCEPIDSIVGDLAVVGHSDHSLTTSITQRFPHVKHWYAINNETTDGLGTSLPLGITNKEYTELGDTKMMIDALKTSYPLQNMVYLNICVDTFPSERLLVKTLYSQLPYVTYVEQCSRVDFMGSLRSHSFCLAPRGNGLDTHRLWEALYMGCIPIVKAHPMFASLHDLPIYFVEEWTAEVLTLDQLQKIRNTYHQKRWNMDKLYQSYWSNKILLTKSVGALPSLNRIFVLVHVGPPPPSYMQDCVRQIRRYNPHGVICVISDSPRAAWAEAYVQWIIPYETQTSKKYKASCHVDKAFRDGFWFHAMMRLFVVYDFMELTGATEVIHMEYDNLIYFHADEVWKPLINMACTRLDNNRCLANIMLIRNASYLRDFIHYVIDNPSSQNEMQVLSDFQSKSRLMFILPTSPVPSLVSDDLHSHMDTYNHRVIFDAAPLGQFIGGVDARNMPGDTTGFMSEAIPWPELKPDWIQWNEQKEPFFHFPNMCPCRIMNLHIHSKNLSRFT